MNADPKVSIILCTYNRARYIRKAVAGALAQTYPNIEIVVVDDASTDGTARVLGEFKNRKNFVILRNRVNQGVSRARNRGVSRARGTYIAVLDSDDYWIDRLKLRKQVSVLEADPGVGVVGTNFFCVDGRAKVLRRCDFHTDDGAIRKRILWNNQFAHSTVLYRKDLFKKVGGYDEGLALAEDLDLWLKIGKESSFRNIPEYTTSHLMHPGQISRRNRKALIAAIAAINGKYKNDYPGYRMSKIMSYVRSIAA